MTIGQRVAQKRRELGLSQEALGDQLGVSRQSIYKWESDSALPEIDKLIGPEPPVWCVRRLAAGGGGAAADGRSGGCRSRPRLRSGDGAWRADGSPVEYGGGDRGAVHRRTAQIPAAPLGPLCWRVWS